MTDFTNSNGRLVKIGWNWGNDDSNVEEHSLVGPRDAHWYRTYPSLPGVWRVYATYKGVTKEVSVVPMKDYLTDESYYIQFEEPQTEPRANSCISVNSKHDGVRVLIEVDDAQM